MVILNVLFAVLVLAVLVGAHLYAVATQHRDHGAVHTGPVFHRHVWSDRRRRPRPVSVERRSQPPRAGQPWPAA
jgi:hypothetical protein